MDLPQKMFFVLKNGKEIGEGHTHSITMTEMHIFCIYLLKDANYLKSIFGNSKIKIRWIRGVKLGGQKEGTVLK